MRAIVIPFSLGLWLAACGGDDPRYRSTELLERPPILAVTKSTEQPIVLEDDSIVPKKKHKKGLEEDVYLKSSNPPVIHIKQPFAEAWNTVSQALTQSEIKITDSVREKGLYFVSYNPGTLLGAVSSLLKTEPKQVIYVLTVEEAGQEETRVTVKKASEGEQSSTLETSRMDGAEDDDSEALLYQLFETLRDDLLTV